MQQAGQQTLSDTQKNIVLSYLPLNPGILESPHLCQNMVEELNASCAQIQDHSTWSTLIRSWKESVRKDYFYAKKMRSNIFLIEDLQLLLHMKDSLDDTTNSLIKHENGVICSICLADIDEQETCNLFTTFVDDNLTLWELLDSLTKVFAVKQDRQTDVICYHCSKILKMMHNFRQICEKNDEQLRQHFSHDSLSLETKNVLDFNAVFVIKKELPYDETDQDSGENLTPMNDSQNNLQMENTKIQRVPKNSSKKGKKTKRTNCPKRKITKENQCEQCEKKYASPKSLKKHIKYMHLLPRPMIQKGPFICELCDKIFPTKYLIRSHMNIHNTERFFVCETCGKCFRTANILQNHQSVHSTEKLFHCTLCSYTTNNKGNLRVHDRIHSGVKPYNCDFCDLSFTTSGNKLKHIRMIHLKLKPYKCPLLQCDKTFSELKMARRHTVIHTGAKPYQCPVCTSSYGWHHRLRKHMKTLHEGVEVPKEASFHFK